MVHFEEDKIIIEIETPKPIEDTQTMQRSLIEIISILNYDHIETIQQNLFFVCMLINELNIDSEGLKSMFNTKDGRRIFKDRINETFINAIAKDEMETINICYNTPEPSKHKLAEIEKLNNQLNYLKEVEKSINGKRVKQTS